MISLIILFLLNIRKRKIFTDDSTVGELSINGEFVCFTLEDKVRDVKIQNITAIPYGKYEIVINFSNHFQQYIQAPYF